MLESAAGIGDNFSQRALCRFDPLLAALEPLRRSLAHGLSAGLSFTRVIFDTTEDISGLVHQLKSRRTGGWCGRPNKAQDVIGIPDRRPSVLLRHNDVGPAGVIKAV